MRRKMILSTNKANEITEIALSQLGKPFDSSSLWDFLADSPPGERDWRAPDHWFCAELTIWAIEKAGYWPFPLNWPKNRVSPTDIFLIFLTDPRWLNRNTFWAPIPGLKMGPHES